MEGKQVSQLRIGELSRRVGVPTTLLRAWERRYGLLKPARSDGNFRLYSPDDVARIWAMKGHLARGHAAAEAAQMALAEDPVAIEDAPAQTRGPGQSVEELRLALMQFDEAAAHRILDRAFALDALEQVIGDLILPCLHLIGDTWERGDVGVAQEHFASTLLRSRLLSLAQGWSSGLGPAALLACPPGELHDIGLISFGVALWRRGWRIYYVGQDTPIENLRQMATAIEPDLVVLAAHTPEPFIEAAPELRKFGGETNLAIAGAGASQDIAADLQARVLPDDAMAAATTLPLGIA